MVLQTPEPGYQGPVVTLFIDNSKSIETILPLLQMTIGSIMKRYGITEPLLEIDEPEGLTPMCNSFSLGAQLEKDHPEWNILARIAVTDGAENYSIIHAPTGKAGIDALSIDDRSEIVELTPSTDFEKVAVCVHKSLDYYNIQIVICLGDTIDEVAEAYNNTATTRGNKPLVVKIDSSANVPVINATVNAMFDKKRTRHVVLSSKEIGATLPVRSQAHKMVREVTKLVPRKGQATLETDINAAVEHLMGQPQMKAWNNPPPDPNIVADVVRSIIEECEVNCDFVPAELLKKAYKGFFKYKKAINSLFSYLAKKGVWIKPSKTVAEKLRAKYTVIRH